jgi:hypothetical protein
MMISDAIGGLENRDHSVIGEREGYSLRKTIGLGKHDAIDIPRDSSVSVETDSRTDIADLFSGVTGHYPLQVVRGTRLYSTNEPPA